MKKTILLVLIFCTACASEGRFFERNDRGEPWFFIQASDLETPSGMAEGFRIRANRQFLKNVDSMPTGNAQEELIRRAHPEMIARYKKILADEVLINTKDELSSNKKRSPAKISKAWTGCLVSLNQAGLVGASPLEQRDFMIECMSGEGFE